MPNGKMLLSIKGKQDSYTKWDTTHTLFKKKHKQYSYFGQNWTTVSCSENYIRSFNTNTQYEFRIPVQGDLISNMFLKVNMPPSAGAVHGLNLIDTVSIKYNGQVLCSMETNFIYVHSNLHNTKAEYKRFENIATLEKNLYIPLPFWFTKNPGSAFPIWLLKNPQITFELSTSGDSAVPSISDIELLIQYTNITPLEKNVFEQSSLEYLIEQVEVCANETIEVSEKRYVLPNTHFIKYLAWNVVGEGKYIEKTVQSIDGIKSTSLIVNGNPVFLDYSAPITSLIQRYNSFNIPGNDLNIHVYSFSVEPTRFQSSGFISTGNFDSASLDICYKELSTYLNPRINIYMVRNNICRFKDGKMSILYN
tara:strand:- start:5018 stop:6109 length:1092 start_codon:yes stop_codon:yes gene_type:complete